MGNKYATIKAQALQQREHSLATQTQKIISKANQLKLTQAKAKQIAYLTIVELVHKLNQHTLTSQELITALCWRTVTIGKEYNVFTYVYFQHALEIAIKCDQLRKEEKKRNLIFKDMQVLPKQQWSNYFSPLFGIPISIKDVFHFEGRQATIGLMKNALKHHEQSELITCFRNAGMIPFVQTNVPQFGMAMETGNLLWGRTLNPWNKGRAVGGSSGGEGAIISARCSVLGVGSDIGGSIRIPSDHCGIFGLKPHSKRISNKYHASLSQSFQSFAQNIPNNLGPLAKSAQDLALFMSVTTNQQTYKEEYDPYTKIVPFDVKQFSSYQESSGKKYRVGYVKQLKDIEPSATTTRAVNQLIQLLKNEGHQLIPIQIPNEREIIRHFISEYLSCGAKNYKQMLNGQKYVKEYRAMFMTGGLRAPGRFILRNIAWLLMPRTYFYYLQKKPFGSIMEYQTHIGEIAELRKQWIKYWRQQKLNFVIAPGFGCQAFPHEYSQRVGLVAAYTFIWNVLDMTVGAMPVTRVKQNQQQYKSRFNDLITKDLKAVGDGSIGLPAGVQIIGLPYHEQRVLGFMSMLERKIKFYEKQGTPGL